MLKWEPQGKRKRGRPKNTWKNTLEKEMRVNEIKWSTMEVIAEDRAKWRELVSGLCSTRSAKKLN